MACVQISGSAFRRVLMLPLPAYRRPVQTWRRMVVLAGCLAGRPVAFMSYQSLDVVFFPYVAAQPAFPAATRLQRAWDTPR
jgi:hypothetical protein